MPDPDPTFTAEQAAQANTALRAALDLPPEAFPVAQFVAMISDEIEQLRAAGRDDEAIAQIVRESTGGVLTAEDISEHYAPPEARGWAGQHGG
ncbi:hypothetical protein Q8W71_27225 [Methylobacterium sp. NEAU 140]|uniref:hypothetical protein n=1 Tax=Methylobacterium sp. NEAU 140 TaxID=3064945 RepID=UPI002733129B|nr:hypothetical protein [Methylobacterium sp. NEAU 140]MDP4026320.1 hypothetical protein [Methylobacterium sp. NEAU 140]